MIKSFGGYNLSSADVLFDSSASNNNNISIYASTEPTPLAVRHPPSRVR
jgi:hypothetical protein